MKTLRTHQLSLTLIAVARCDNPLVRPRTAFADALLTGAVTSATGEKMGGVTRIGQGGQVDDHHQRFHRRVRQLLFSAAAQRQIQSLGASVNLSNEPTAMST